MGAADIVPGVSGGTIALVLGIYERLVASVRAGSSALGSGLKGDWDGVKRWIATVEWQLIIPLGIGIVLAVLSLTHLIDDLLENQAIAMAALFMGLVAGSILIAWRMIKAATAMHVALAVGLGVVAFILLGLQTGTSDDAVAQATSPALWAFFISGSIAICAMILPGISGSFLLVILGMYGPVISAVKDRDLTEVAVFAVGAVVGLAVFSQFLHWALTHYHDIVMSLLIGLMLGSFRVLWPWPAGIGSTALERPDMDIPLAIGMMIVGFVLVMGLGWVAARLNAVEDGSVPVQT